MTRPEPISTSDAPAGEVLTLHCVLETGVLQVRCESMEADEPLPFGFAERNNPRRAFLFVSRVLGRHLPVRPSLMRNSFTRLADDIPADLPGPVVLTGMAETAVGLGAGVHDAWLARTGRTDVLFLSTTRARFDQPLLASFREEHSHASAHQVLQPLHAGDRALLATARSLVMVDDEASSGDTFKNLAAALRAVGFGSLQRIHTAVLTDWRGLAAPASEAVDELPRWSRSALLYGSFHWTARAAAPARALPDADRAREARVKPIGRTDDGRLGRSCRSAGGCPAALRELLHESLQERSGAVHVLGTGEHVWEPFLVAEALERDGLDVRFSATTRSPILPGHEVRRGLSFTDHEGLGITNYLYNVDPAALAHIVLCVDTSLASLDPRLLAALQPHVLVGETLHPWASLAGQLRDVPPAESFDIGPAMPGS